MFVRRRKTDCEIVRELLSTYLDAQLGSIDHDRVEYHVDICPECRQELETLRVTRELLHRIPAVTAPRSFTLAEAPVRRTWFPSPLPEMGGTAWLRTAAAAAVMAFALLISFDFTGVLDKQPTDAQSGTNEIAVATPDSGEVVISATPTSEPETMVYPGTGVPEATQPLPGSDTSTGIAGKVTPGEPQGLSGETNIPEQVEAVDPFGESGVSSPTPRSITPAWLLPVEIVTGALVVILGATNFLIWRRRQTSR